MAQKFTASSFEREGKVKEKTHRFGEKEREREGEREREIERKRGRGRD